MKIVNFSASKVIFKKCEFCSEEYFILLNNTDFADWTNGKYAQDVWPHLNAGEREMIISGTHPECWDKMFKDAE